MANILSHPHKLDSESICPCGSESTYVNCCQPYHLNRTKAPTAEQLMRSRYSAYVVGAIDYLVQTTLPAVRRTDLRLQYQSSYESIQWIGLKVIRCAQGSETDKIGKVEFEATYIQEGQRAIHHELSRFRRHGGHWHYVDGEIRDLPVSG